MQRVSLVVMDVDNTLFDWVAMWHAAFSAMLAKVVDISDIPQPQLEREAKAVFETYGTTEYAFVLQELPSLRMKHPDGNLPQIYSEAIVAYRQARKAHLHFYPGVFETLQELRRRGCRLVAYTESKRFYTVSRFRDLGLDGVIDELFLPPDHRVPEEIPRMYPAEHYELRVTTIHHTPEKALKPNPVVLREIVETVGGDPERAIYVGDSLMKDIVMAQCAEVTDVWAAYGAAQHRPEYDLLRRVTHWTKEEVERERALADRLGDRPEPTYALPESFQQLLGLFDFVSFSTMGARVALRE